MVNWQYISGLCLYIYIHTHGYLVCFFDSVIFCKAPGVQQEYSHPQVMSLNSQSVWIKETVNISLPQFAIPETKFLYVTITGNPLNLRIHDYTSFKVCKLVSYRPGPSCTKVS